MINTKVSAVFGAALTAAALLSPLAPARAAILFAGGEDTSLSCIGTCLSAGLPYVSGTSGGIAARTGYARVALPMGNSTTVADPPANRLQTPTFTSSSNIWVHFQFAGYGTNTTTSGVQGLLIRSPDGVSRIVVRQTGTAGTLKVSTRNSAGTITDLATASGTFASGGNNNTTQFDLNVNYTCSGAGGVTMYLAGVQVINYSGNPCTDAATSLNQVELAAFTNNAFNQNNCNSGNTPGFCISEIIVADEDTRGMSLWTLAPQASGNTQSWTPNTVGNINPTQAVDGTVISSSSSNQLSEWTTPTAPPSGSWGVKAVVQEARTRVGTTGPQTFTWLCRSAATDNTSGSNSPSIAFGNFSNQIWATNCTSGSGWAIGDIATGFNLGIKSTP